MGEKTPVSQRGGDTAATDGGWPPALVQLYRDERTNLVRLAYLLTSNQGAAEEIVQDAFIAARGATAEVRDPLRYVRAAVVNRCRSWGRHQQVVKATIPERPDPVVLEVDELWDALARLDPRRRAAIVLRYYVGLPHREIADLLGCRPATVRTSIHRALKQLSKEIQR